VKFPTYARTKPSGVEWLGDVPEPWAVKRLKYLATINDESLPETTSPDFEFEYVDIGGVNAVDGVTAAELVVFESAPSRARRKVRNGDTIVSTVRTYLRAIAPIKNPPENLIVSTGFAVVRPRTVEPSFLAYALRESSFVESVVARSVGVSYPAVNASEIGGIAIPLPAPAEQRGVAAFLGRETGRLDRLVAKKRKLIERLREKRTTLISRTVTRGLPPAAARAASLHSNPPLKSSGIEWLNDIPKHWEVKAIKWESPVKRGASPRPIDDERFFDDEGEYAWVRIADVTAAGALLEKTEQRMSPLGSSLSVKLEPGALFLSIAGTVGKPCITTIKCCIHDGFVYFPKWKGDAKFLFYIFASGEPYKGLGKMGTQLNLNTDTVGSIRIGVPPIPEQAAIAAYLDEETAKLDALAAKVGTAVARLQEYRTALITAAVTGKIDVRNLSET
jgi:type I restriction enzyme S subunit